MNRSYSMRQQRSSNTPSGRNSAPPPSTRAHRLFGRGSLVHSFRRSTAGAFAPELAKKLAQLVKMEKNLMQSMEQVGKERRDLAYQLSQWGEGCEADISDITDKLGVLLYEIGTLEDQHVDQYDRYRVTLKSIRNTESSVQPCRDRRQRINEQIAHLRSKDPDSPKLVTLEQELVRSEAETLVAEAQLSNITREKLKTAFTLQFDALQEHCEKVATIAGYGKHLLELVDDSPVTPGQARSGYEGKEASKSIIQDCEGALSHWDTQRVLIRSPLSRRSQNLSRRRRAKAPSSSMGDSAIGSWDRLRESRENADQPEAEPGMEPGMEPCTEAKPGPAQELPVSSHFSDSEDEVDPAEFSEDATQIERASEPPSEAAYPVKGEVEKDRKGVVHGRKTMCGLAAGLPV